MTATDPVVGVPRTDPILSLDDNDLARRDACIAETVRLHRDAHDAMNWAAIGRFLEPRVGDLVLELTRASWSKDQHMRTIGFGYLVARQGEAWFVQYGPNPDDICDWQGCMFIRVPESAVVLAMTEEAR